MEPSLKKRPPRKRALDKDLKQVGRIEKAARLSGQPLVPIGLGILFLLFVWIYADMQVEAGTGASFIVVAGLIGGYMALNIGANDVANNMGPAVGARALTMGGALAVAAVCEGAGALLAGADVVETVSKRVIDPTAMSEPRIFIAAMMSALLAGALWINLATVLGAPVSTTHSIIGGILGAGLAAAGAAVVNWPVLAAIVASWVVSPLLGGLIAAIFLILIKSLVLEAPDRIGAARQWVPVFVGLTAAAFSAYLIMKGLGKVWKPPGWTIALIALGFFVLGYLAMRRVLARSAPLPDDSRKSISQLFTMPLVIAAALLSFAHGANDVANAVGPLAAIVGAATGQLDEKVVVPAWIMLVGALGIAVGLALFGPKLIRTVGEKITRLNPMRAFCVALSAAITVLAASALGLPVSSTHIAVGAVFGVGLTREIRANRRTHLKGRQIATMAPAASAPTSALAGASSIFIDGDDGTEDDVRPGTPEKLAAKAEKAKKRRLVRRRHLLTIIAAWLITVPLSALLAALCFWVLAWAIESA